MGQEENKRGEGRDRFEFYLGVFEVNGGEGEGEGAESSIEGGSLIWLWLFRTHWHCCLLLLFVVVKEDGVVLCCVMRKSS